MRTRILTAATLCLLGAPALTQESDADRQRALATLHIQQDDAVKRLERLLIDAKSLIKDLERRGEDQKADLLRKALGIIARDDIELGTVQGANSESKRLLGDLKEAMDRMQRLLKEDATNTEEVQLIGRRVVDTLGRVLEVLVGYDELRSLEKREKDLGDVQRDVRRTTEKQRELTRKTREVVPRTEAEKTAEQAVRDLEQLQAMLDQIDRDARRGLAELEKQRELAARLEAMLDQQRRLRRETLMRAGEADTVRPKLNRALAELEAISKAARRAADEEADRMSSAETAKQLGRLAKRQSRLADELAKRAALEAAKEALDENDAVSARKAVQEIAVKPGGEELKKAARQGDADALRKAVEAELRRMPPRSTTADDQDALRRAMKGAAADAPDQAKGALHKADELGKQVSRKLRIKAGDMTKKPSENTASAANDARKAAEALEQAQKQAQKQARKQAQGKTPAGATAPARSETAERAGQLAAELEALAQQEEAKAAGLRPILEEAKRAMERAKAELQTAEKATAEQRPDRAAEETRNAAERAERAVRRMRDGVRQRGDLAQRQGKVTDEQRDAEGEVSCT